MTIDSAVNVTIWNAYNLNHSIANSYLQDTHKKHIFANKHKYVSECVCVCAYKVVLSYCVFTKIDKLFDGKLSAVSCAVNWLSCSQCHVFFPWYKIICVGVIIALCISLISANCKYISIQFEKMSKLDKLKLANFLTSLAVWIGEKSN